MKLTNNHGLPEYLVRWLSRDEYDHIPGTYSATGLLKPARMLELTRRHGKDLTIDVADLIASRYGTALHDSISHALEGAGWESEQRYKASFEGVRIVGKPDLLFDGRIVDFKSTSVWKFIHREYDEYVKQLSIYKWLLGANGVETGEGEICFLFTDWTKSKCLQDQDYPKLRTATIRLALWPAAMTEGFMRERIKEIEAARDCLPLCPDAELWRDEPVWALMKQGKKRSRKNCKTLEEAEELKAEGEYIEARPGKVKRCNYCACRPVCDQYKQMLNDGVIAD